MEGEFIYIFYSYVFGLYYISSTDMATKKNHGCHKNDSFCLFLLRSNPYISNLYIMDRNTRLSSHTIDVTYSDYILVLLVCGYFTLTLKAGGCCNMLESTTDRIPLIKSSRKWTQILFIISNSKLGIWICSQLRICVTYQSNLYDVLTIYHTRPFPTQYKKPHTQNKFYI